ncbi:MAG: CobW family GTP-binding protein [Pseudoclavibacter sp.]
MTREDEAVHTTVPVIAITGYLGSGKTTLLNHLLRAPSARIGAIVNDFGAVNIDAGFVTGQIDEAASISGGCICCLTDAGGLASAIDRLAAPRLALDAILIEASGIADPVAVQTLVRRSGVRRARFGGLVDIVDAAEHFATVDRYALAPLRYAAATLVVINKLDRLDDGQRETTIARIRDRVHERNPNAHVIGAIDGRVDPALLFDAAGEAEADDQLPIRELLDDAIREAAAAGEPHGQHAHAEAVTVARPGTVEAGRVVDLLLDPPPGAYRLKGTVHVRRGTHIRSFDVNVAGSGVHARTSRGAIEENTLVAIGVELDAAAAREQLEHALEPLAEDSEPAAIARLDRLRRLSAPAKPPRDGDEIGGVEVWAQ